MQVALLIASLLISLSLCVQATEPVKFDYMMNCQGCHLPNGEGYPMRDVPKLKDHMGKFLHVDGGREFLVQVPGSALSDLDSARLTAVLNWMLMTFSMGELPEEFRPYTKEEVEHLRRSPLIDVKGTRKELIERILEVEIMEGKI